MRFQIIYILFVAHFFINPCFSQDNELLSVVERSLDRATKLSIEMAKSLENDTLLPRSYKNNKLVTSDAHWWCSGFFPGVLWYLYEHNPNDELKCYAQNYTERIRKEQFTTDNHDVGFMIYCSFGNGSRLLGLEDYKKVVLQASKSLSTRYDKKIGMIRSWDFNEKDWQYPVIIDNMMNLEMLMWASKEFNNAEFRRIAINHADKTLKEHFRPDYSCCHLVDFDTITGKSRIKQTVQGYADESSWARGQGWALYGYTMMFRETGMMKYLKHAEGIAHFILNHPNLPKDKIPYWDFNDPGIPNIWRDASAAAVIASALIELSQLTGDKKLSKKCIETAIVQIKTLSSSEYLAEPGTNGNFILKHSVGHLPANSEIDVPLTYADYYYVEALMRYKKLAGSLSVKH
jgi:hypothetical protein